MGLLDFNMPGLDTPQGQGLLSAAFSLMQAKKLPGQKGAFAGALGDAGQQYLQSSNTATDQMQKRKYLDAQMQAQQMQLEAARKAQADKDRMEAYFRNMGQPQGAAQAMANGQGPTLGNAQRLGQPFQPDPLQVLRDLGPQGLEQFTKINSTLNPAPKYETVAGGSSLYKMGPNGPELAMTAPSAPKEESKPELTRLINQMEALPPGSPFRKFYENAISKATTHQPGTSVSVNTGQKGFDNTLKLRGDFRSEPIYKAHQDVQSAHAQITTSLRQASPAGDLAGATKLMKILDPGSVVRESELGMAMAASGMIDRMENYARNIMNGTKLTPTQRKDFQALADTLFAESAKQYNAKRGEYKGIADRNELSSVDVVGPEAGNANKGWSITPVPGK